jgi:hypothetical protein
MAIIEDCKVGSRIFEEAGTVCFDFLGLKRFGLVSIFAVNVQEIT